MKRDAYASSAKTYDKFVEPAAKRLRAAGIRMFPPQENLAVLDVACGTGTQLLLYRMAGCRLCGIDSSPAMLELAREKLGESAELLLMDASSMSFVAGSFDLVTVILALHEMTASVRCAVIQECLRVCKPGGTVLLTDFYPGPYPFPRGWLWKLVVNLMEISSGREHFANYRDFLRRNGLQSLCEEQGVAIKQRFVSDTGVSAVYLLSR